MTSVLMFDEMNQNHLDILGCCPFSPAAVKGELHKSLMLGVSLISMDPMQQCAGISVVQFHVNGDLSGWPAPR